MSIPFQKEHATFLKHTENQNILTPGAVATTLYGARYNSSPDCSNMFLNRQITCSANMSCLTSSPTCRGKEHLKVLYAFYSHCSRL